MEMHSYVIPGAIPVPWKGISNIFSNNWVDKLTCIYIESHFNLLCFQAQILLLQLSLSLQVIEGKFT